MPAMAVLAIDQDKDTDTGSDKEQVKVIIEGDEEEDRSLVRGDEDKGQDAGADGDDPEARRKKNQEARRKRKEKHRQLWERNRQLETMNEGLQKALGEVNARLSKIEEGSVEGYGRRIDQSLAGAERALEAAKAKLRKAVADGDADTVSAATDEIAQIAVDRRELEASKAQFEQSRVKTRDKDPDDGKDARFPADDSKARVVMEQTILRNANIFTRRNEWYDPNDDEDEDSETVRRLDREIAAEGYNPASKDYWEELENRMKEELPHRFKAAKTNGKGQGHDDDDGGKPNGKDRTVITAGSGRSARSNESTGTYRLSKDRVDAIKEAGMWDDPKERQKMIDKYREYDRTHTRN